MLPVLAVTSPCREPWDAMTGDERVRRCGRCDKDVHDLSAMSAAEVEAVVASGRPCVRFRRPALLAWALIAAAILGVAAPADARPRKHGERVVLEFPDDGWLQGEMIAPLALPREPPPRVTGAPPRFEPVRRVLHGVLAIVSTAEGK